MLQIHSQHVVSKMRMRETREPRRVFGPFEKPEDEAGGGAGPEDDGDHPHHVPAKQLQTLQTPSIKQTLPVTPQEWSADKTEDPWNYFVSGAFMGPTNIQLR